MLNKPFTGKIHNYHYCSTIFPLITIIDIISIIIGCVVIVLVVVGAKKKGLDI